MATIARHRGKELTCGLTPRRRKSKLRGMSRFHKMNARWGTIRARHLKREPLCRMCMAKVPSRPRIATEVDHIVPLSAGGTDADDNLQSLCSECHNLKTKADMGHSIPQEIGADGFPTDPNNPWRIALKGRRG